MRGESEWVGMVITAVVSVGVFGAAWLASARARRSKTAGDPDLPRAGNLPGGFVLLAILAFGIIFWEFTPTQHGRAPGPRLLRLLIIAVGTVALAGSATIAVQYFRHYDRGLRRARKRAADGDLDGAIEDLREQIQDKGWTQPRVNELGLLLLQAKQWDEAAAFFRKAEELGDIKGVCRANLGLALLEAGKPDQALPALQEAARTAQPIPVLDTIVAVNAALALAALGRWDDAYDRLQYADARASCLARSQREAIQSRLERARARLKDREQDGDTKRVIDTDALGAAQWKA